MTSENFAAWMAAHGLGSREASILLGVSQRGVQDWMNKTNNKPPPLSVAAGCAAIDLASELWCGFWKGNPDGWRDELRSRIESL